MGSKDREHTKLPYTLFRNNLEVITDPFFNVIPGSSNPSLIPSSKHTPFHLFFFLSSLLQPNQNHVTVYLDSGNTLHLISLLPE